MPWDEQVEPGGLMQRMADEAGWPDDRGVAQLNHPYAEADFGRDLGWARALGVDLAVPLPQQDDGTGPGGSDNDTPTLTVSSPTATRRPAAERLCFIA